MRRFSWLITLLLLALGAFLVLRIPELPNGLRWPARALAIAVGGLGLARALPALWRSLTGPLRRDGRIDPLLALLFAAITGLVVWNALHHGPQVNYDDKPHREVMQLWSRLHFPTREDTRGFHYAPLAYAPASLALALEPKLKSPEALRLMQLANVAYAWALCAGIVGLCRRLAPHRPFAPHFALLLLGILPCFYRTFAMPRPEPLLATLVVWSAAFGFDLVTGRSPDRRRRPWGTVIGFGLTTGAMLLTRQWGAYLIPAFALAWLAAWAQQGRAFRTSLVPKTLAAALIALAVAGWFYAGLQRLHGSVTAFNRESDGFHLSNQPRSFWLGTGDGLLFKAPAFRARSEGDHRQMVNQFLPVFYSDTWGDYWAYWQIRPEAFVADPPDDLVDNMAESLPRLGRNNLIGLFPSALLFAGLATAGGLLPRLFRRRPWRGRAAAGRLLLWSCPLTTLAGYFWFLVSYPNTGAGDNIKATYLFQLFPFLAVFAGTMLSGWTSRRADGRPLPAGLILLAVTLLLPLSVGLGRSFVTAHDSARGLILYRRIREAEAFDQPVLLALILLAATGLLLLARFRPSPRLAAWLGR